MNLRITATKIKSESSLTINSTLSMTATSYFFKKYGQVEQI